MRRTGRSTVCAGAAASILLLASGCVNQTPSATPDSTEYLYLWTASADTTAPDFLAVLDVTDTGSDTDPDTDTKSDSGDRYGRLVATLPVPGRNNGPHHTEHEMPDDGQLFANGFRAGQSFVFDLTDPRRPEIVHHFGGIDEYSHPHSFLRLPGGNVLATFQRSHRGSGLAPGGLVEFTPSGDVVKTASAEQPGLDPATRVYSAGVLPMLDRVVTTTTDMVADSPASNQLQVWRLSDLSLLETIILPNGPRGDEGHLTAEPRVLDDGKTVLVSTFNCGLYMLTGLDSDNPLGELVASFPQKEGTYCAIPVVSGDFYLVTVPAWSAVVSLDISDPRNPREVGRATLDEGDIPHWIAISPDNRRVVVTGYGTLSNRVVMLRFDSSTGSLAIDERFSEAAEQRPGYSMAGKSWPHGGSAAGIPHGAVFSLQEAAGRFR